LWIVARRIIRWILRRRRLLIVAFFEQGDAQQTAEYAEDAQHNSHENQARNGRRRNMQKVLEATANR
jgi:hypothetical protein